MRLSISNLSRNAVLALLLSAFAADARAVTIDWRPVGNPGNAADPTVMTTDGTSGYGSVAHNYQIDKYDVTNAQYAEFLNTKDPTGANTLFLWNMGMNESNNPGIAFNAGNPNGSRYAPAAGTANQPVHGETSYEALRFANWMNNGQGNGDTETGAYTLGALGAKAIPINGASIMRNSGATIFLPSENEWYKAAYYNPATSSYFQYSTSTNAPPTTSSPTGTPNHINARPGGPFSFTDVGAYTGTSSPYGLFDMGGKVEQWNEALLGSNRGVRGGSSFTLFSNASASFRTNNNPADFSAPSDIGFRVAEIPEPSSLALAARGFISIAWRRRRR